MPTPPHVVGLTLCNRLSFDPATAELSLVGIFNRLAFRRWPTPEVNFTAFATLFGGSGEGTIELVVSRLETEEMVYRYRRWYAAPGPGDVHLEMRVTRCVFLAPGTHGFTLRFDGQDLTFRYLEVVDWRQSP
jgi:hypothetical protein